MIVLKNIYKLFNFQLIGLHRLTILLFVLIVSPNILAVDTDGDGIDDAIDLDSDNDGILNRDEGVICTYPNVSWSAGHNVVDGTESYGFGCTSGYGGTSQWSNGFYSENDKNKTFYAYWNISVKPGVPFTITATVSSVNAQWKNNGVSSGTFRILNQPNSSLVVTNYGNNFSGITRTETFIPTSNNVRVQFDFKMKRTNFNCAGYNLPEILLRFSFKKQVWTTCSSYDFDQDGIPNYLDLDSDNDGISDLAESGADISQLDPDNNGVIYFAQFQDSDNDGLADIVESINGNNQGINPNNQDNDSRDDYIDLDSDNDRIPDAIEGKKTSEYFAKFSNDGDVRNDDSDGDGIIDAYDNSVGHSGNFILPINTDGVDNPDYLDNDSDNDSKSDKLESGNVLKALKFSDPDGSINNPMIDLPNEIGDTIEVAYREVCNINLITKSPFCESDGISIFAGSPAGGTWSGSGISAGGVFDPNSAGPGTHVISYSLGGTCVENVNIVVNADPSFTISKVDETCTNSNGSITVTSTGGTGPFDYNIDGGGYQASNVFNGLASGTYTIGIRDANTCTATQNVTITDSPGPSISSTTDVDPTCGNSNGSITVTATGGTGTIEYNIDGGAYQASNVFSSLAAGTYTMGIRDDNGCTATLNVTLSDLGNPSITSTTDVDPTCGNSNGSITVTASGGTGTIEYNIDGGAYQASNVFSSLVAGTYTMGIRDDNGCTATLNVTLSDLGNPSITSTTDVDPTCGNSNGSITVTASGGTGTIEYNIDGGAYQASNVFSSLAAGTYTMGIRDDNGCTVTLNVTLTDLGNPSISSTTDVDPTCGNSNGSITVTATGGTAPILYNIDGGANQASNVFSGLAAGTYTIGIKDALGCTASLSVTINDVGGPSITGTTDVDPTCGNSNGSITVTASGGTGTIEYNIDGGAYQASNVFSSLAAGTYTMGIRDDNGCTVTLNVTLTDLGNPSISSTTDVDPTCGNSNGSITVTASGGTGTIEYNIDGGAYQASNVFSSLAAGTYTMGIRDDNGCTATLNVTLTDLGNPSITSTTDVDPTCGNSNGSITVTATGGTAPILYNIDGGANQASNVFSGLAAGTYTIGIEDALGCTASTSVTINDVGGPSITGTTDVDPTCGNSNGSITVTATGGTAPILYNIDGGANQASNVFSGLAAGTYTIGIEDVLGCTASTSVTINDVGGPSITGTTDVDPTCGNSNGSITVTATGGTAPILYNIDGGANQASNVFNGLAAGTYTIGIEDALGCTASTSVTINDVGGPSITGTTDVDPTCGNSNGSITVTATGGTAPILYNIDGGANQASNVFSGLAAGTYTIGIEDVLGCTASTSVTINDVGGPSITGTTDLDPSCGNSNGSITVTATGGTAPILYNIDGGANQASNVFNGLAAGTYTIGIEDALGCTASTSVAINMAATLTIDNITKNDVTCMAQGDVTITVSGGTAPLEYSIDNGVSYQGSNFFGGLSAGTYDVVVRDANLCTDNSTVTIDPGTSPTIDNVARTDETCAALGSISLTASGGTPPLTYSLDNGATFFSTTNFENLSAGNYTVMVMDAIGCMDNRSVAIDPPANIVIDSVVVIDDSCSACQGEATIYASGPSPFNYSIDNNATSQASNVFTNLCSGALNIVVSTGSCSTNGNGTVANLGTVADATISGPGTVCVTQGDIVLSAATPGGVWSGTGVNPVTGVFNTQSSGPGSFTLTYTLGGACGNTDNITLTVTDTVDPGIDPVSAQCELGSPVSLTASESGGVWSGVGVSGNEFDPANAGAGTHTIYYTLTGVCSEVDSTEVTVENKIDPNISPVNPLCITQSPVNLTTAVSGGTWSGSVVSASGLFDPSTAGAGTHTVYYTLPGACTNNDSINIAVIDTTRPSIDPVSPLCVTGGSVSLTGSTPGGSWSGIGVNGNQFDPQTAGPGTHYVLYTISGTCTDTAGMSISVTDTLNPGIHPVDPVCVIGSPVSLTANIGGGTWSGNGVSDHHETFNPQTAGAGTHKVYYTVTGICVDRDSINIAVSDTITPAIDPVSTQCTGNAAFQLTTSIPGGTWSGNGITHASNGTFDPAIAQAGTHTITYTINIGACTSSPSIDIDVFDSQDATIAPAGPFCSVDSPTLLTAVDGAGIWSGTGVTASTGSFDPATAGAGTHEIIYTIAGICGDADTIMVEVIQQPDASITAVPIQCIGGKPVQLTAATTGGI